MPRLSRAWLLPVAYLVWLLTPGLSTDARMTGAAVGMLLAPAIACVASFRAARRQRERLLWLFFGSCLAWALGDLLSVGYVAVSGKAVPIPSLADPLYLAWVPLLAIALLLLPSSGYRAVGRLRLLFDSLVAAAGLLAVSWPLVLRPIVERQENLFATITSCAYTAGDLFLLALLIPLTFHASSIWRGTLLRLGSLVLLCTTSDVAFGLSTGLESQNSVPVVTVGWVAAFSLVPSLVRRWPSRTAMAAEEQSVRHDATRRPWFVLASYLPALAGATTAFGVLLAGRFDVITGSAVLAIVVLGLIRQALAHMENEELTSDLESRVDQRTRQLATLAYTDLLTGLDNRARFQQQLDRLSAEGGSPVLLLLDLDGFKTVNDSLGHAAGDELLELAARRLRRSCPGADVLARLGGDEFAVLLPSSAAEEATAVADLILADLSSPFQVGRAEVRVGGSIGIAGGPTTAVDDVLRHADLAMYGAKAAGRNRWQIFDPAMGRAAERRRSVEDDLRVALTRNQFVLDYQPVVDLLTGAIVGVEPLLRWHHPERGLVPPDEFIAIAEEMGLIVPIGAWVLQEACRRGAGWKNLLPAEAEFCVGINLSVHQLGPDFLALVERTLRATGFPPSALVIEVTESIFMDDDRTDAQLLQDLRRLGPMVFLDDFGTGYSSLSYLKRFPVDGLKIDRSFVTGLGESGEDVIANAIMRIADSLGLAVVAEGIEEQHQHDALVALGCRLGQGFGLGRPMSGDDFTELLARALPGCVDDAAIPAPRMEQAPDHPGTSPSVSSTA